MESNDPNANDAARKRCPFCGVAIKVTRIERHIEFKCPKNPMVVQTARGTRAYPTRVSGDAAGWWHGGE